MPSIKQEEYNRLRACQQDLEIAEYTIRDLLHEVQIQARVTEKWKRYYLAVREALKVEEEIEIPGCFSLMDTVQYIVERQEEANNWI